MENIILQSGEVSPEYSEAVRTHQRIMANGEICAQSLCEICQDLKKMRDEKLYAEFGYESFDEYCEKMAGIKARMAYNYISTIERLGTSVLQSNARLGITKLELIAGMNPVERAEKLENGEFDGMSVAEIRELVKKSKDQGEQISLLETQIAELKSAADDTDTQESDSEAERLREELENLREEMRQKESAHKSELEAAREAAYKEAEEAALKNTGEEQSAEVQSQIDKAVAAAKKEAEKAAKEKAKKKTEEQESKIKDLEAALSAAGTEKEKLEKQLALSDTKSAKAMVYIQNLQDSFNALFALISEMDEEQQNKFKGAVLKLAGAMQKKAEG